jgi:hypothetical protein
VTTGSVTDFGGGPADGEARHSAPLRVFQPLEVCCQLGEHVDPADHAELPAELSAGDGTLPRVVQIGKYEIGGYCRSFAALRMTACCQGVPMGNVTPTPLPPPVREGAV